MNKKVVIIGKYSMCMRELRALNIPKEDAIIITNTLDVDQFTQGLDKDTPIIIATGLYEMSNDTYEVKFAIELLRYRLDYRY